MSTLLDAETREPLFQQGEPYTLRQFVKIAKKSAEGKKAYKGDYNFGKGIKLAEYLRKNIPGIAKSMKAKVYRSAWNYGENLTVTIELRGKSYDQQIFSFNSANSTRQPTYSFATMFNGAINSTGPRYCPSIEDKINRFADRDRHQFFVEPEGWDSIEIYVTPEDCQKRLLRRTMIRCEYK